MSICSDTIYCPKMATQEGGWIRYLKNLSVNYTESTSKCLMKLIETQAMNKNNKEITTQSQI